VSKLCSINVKQPKTKRRYDTTVFRFDMSIMGNQAYLTMPFTICVVNPSIVQTITFNWSHVRYHLYHRNIKNQVYWTNYL